MPVCIHYWKPYRPAVEYAEQLADAVASAKAGPALIVELGPGARPFSRANEFVGRFDAQGGTPYPGVFHRCDLSRDALPYDDASVDFLYVRHTIEDLDDPAWCLSEIARVAKAGYIEAPSPIAEMSRGVDASLVQGKPAPWRGYYHHRSFVWDSAGTLHVVAKWPFIEHIDSGAGDAHWSELLNAGPLHWNTYFAWSGQLPFHYHQHELDYEIGPQYGALLDRAIAESQASAIAYQNCWSDCRISCDAAQENTPRQT